jgi:hypothetical protein
LQRASLRLPRTRRASLRGRPFFMAFLTIGFGLRERD